MALHTADLLIRPFVPEDLEDVYAFCRLPQVMDPSGMAPAHTTIDQTRQELARWIEGGRRLAIVLPAAGRVIGEISVNPDSEEGREDTRELGFVLHPDYQHRGYMTQTVLAILEQLKERGIRYVWACCFVDNAPSKALIERCGFAFQQRGTYTVKATGQVHESLEYRIDLEA